MSIFECIVDTVREVVGKILPNIVKVLPVSINELAIVLHAVAKIVESVAEALGLGQQNVEDLGDRAIQVHDKGYRTEDFESYEEYVQFIKDFELDPEKSAQIRPEVKAAYGIKVLSEQVEAKYGFKLGDFLPVIASNVDYFTADRVLAIRDAFAKANMAVGDLGAYMEYKLNGTEMGKVEDALVKAESTLKENDGKSEDEIRNTIHGMQR